VGQTYTKDDMLEMQDKAKEVGRMKGIMQGYEKGYKSGYDKGIQECRDEIEVIINKGKDIFSKVVNWLGD